MSATLTVIAIFGGILFFLFIISACMKLNQVSRPRVLVSRVTMPVAPPPPINNTAPINSIHMSK